MGASSVTGVGQGSALKKGMKGSEHMFLGIEKLIGTKVVYSGTATLSSGTYAVVFPQTLPGVAADYIVLCNGQANYAYGASLTTTGFTATGTGSQVVSFAVIRVTGATVVPTPPDRW